MPDPGELKSQLDDYRQMYGERSGRLAAVLDLLADAEITAGRHVPYCSKTRKDGSPSADMAELTEQVRAAKRLVTAVFEELRRSE